MYGYRYRPNDEEIEARRAAAMDVLTAVALGLIGAWLLVAYL